MIENALEKKERAFEVLFKGRIPNNLLTPTRFNLTETSDTSTRKSRTSSLCVTFVFETALLHSAKYASI